ncbi:hypothetical protein BH20ACI4_BH20ACI4_25540 [soil metagenome]
MVRTIMKHTIKILLGFVFLSVVFAGCANAQNLPNQNRQTNESISNPDLSTDEGVIAEVHKRIDAEREKAGITGGSKPKVCVRRLKESEEIIVIGFFRYDYGCHFEGAFVGSRFFEKTEIEMHQNALDALGWEKAPIKEREQLAKFWVEKGLLTFFTVLYTKQKELENQDFHPPKVVSTEKGEIKVTLWIRLPGGRNRTKRFQHLEYRFTKDGGFSGTSTLENLAI